VEIFSFPSFFRIISFVITKQNKTTHQQPDYTYSYKGTKQTKQNNKAGHT